jgi:hypothetical protein
MKHIEVYPHVYSTDFNSLGFYAYISVEGVSPVRNKRSIVGTPFFFDDAVLPSLTSPLEIIRYLLDSNPREVV